MGDTVRFKYIGTTPGADANTYNIFDTTIAFQGAGFAAMHGYKRLLLDLKNAGGNGTLNLYKSPDRGTNWYQVNTQAVTAPASTASNQFDYLIEEYADFKLDWVNGGSAQTTWQPSIALTDSRNPAS